MDLHYEAINIVSQSKGITPVGGRQFIKVSSVLSLRASINDSIIHHQYSGLVSFRTDRFDLLAVQGTLKSLTCPRSFSLTLGGVLTGTPPSIPISLLCFLCLKGLQAPQLQGVAIIQAHQALEVSVVK